MGRPRKRSALRWNKCSFSSSVADELHAARHIEEALRVLQMLHGHIEDRPAAEVRCIHHEVRERVQDAPHAPRMAEIVAVIAAVHQQRQAALDGLVDAHQPRVVHVDALGVGVQLHAFEPERLRALYLG